MQMESWRERGFVPDSDDEDGFDSQDKGLDLNSAGDDGGFASGAAEAGGAETLETAKEDEHDEGLGESEVNVHSDELGSGEETRDAAKGTSGTVVDEEAGLPLPVERARTTMAEEGPPKMEKENQEPRALDEATVYSVDEDVDLPLPDGRPRTPTNDLEGQRAGYRNTANDEVEPRQVRGPSNTGKQDNMSSTPRAEQQRDYWDIPSSSPDLLQLDHHPWRKQNSPATTPTPKAQGASPPRSQNENAGSSPVSSLSSVRSSILDNSNENRPQEPSVQSLEEMLPALDIPEDIMQELDPPTRRSLRQRNPIQLHPYLLEDAKYQRLMKTRGVRPVRIPQQLQPARPAADESQGPEVREEAGSSSDTQMTELHPASSPLDSRQQIGIAPTENTLENGDSPTVYQRRPSSPKSTTEPRSPKRRRVFGPGDRRQNQHLRAISRPTRPQVVIDNTPSSIPHDRSTFDIPSPPRSGTLSSPPGKEHAKFRFPRGFEPPTATPRSETRMSTHDADEAAVVNQDGNEIAQESDDSRSIRSASSHSRSNPDMDDDDGHNNLQAAALRRYQKKIKGVLPASWLRLDQQKQQGVPSATQRNHDRMARLEAESTKGVAKKVTKKTNPASSSRSDHPSSLRNLAEESDDQSANESDEDGGVQLPQRPSNLSGLEDSFVDQGFDGDLPEDNRIDYMFPTLSRNTGQRNVHKHAQKRRKTKTDQARPDGQSKKSRLNRQARLTDAVYRGQRKTSRPQKLPKLGILDAPDVASHSRKEQPQFLRIAARKARSRQDRGRRSPSRKAIRLNSRADTEDANVSLREWRSGRLRQTTLPRASSQTTRRHPLKDRSANPRNAFNELSAPRAKERHDVHIRQAAPAQINAANENAIVQDTSAANAPSDSRPSTRGASTRPVQQRRGNAWVIQRNLAITSLSRNNLRPAVPEVESHRSTETAPSSLQRSLAYLGHDDRLPLNRFLSADTAPQTTSQATIESNRPNPAPSKPAADSRRRHLKKRQPKRLNITHIEDYALPVSVPPEPQLTEPQSEAESHNGSSSVPSIRFRKAYSVNFDVSPLYPGIYFHESTLIGSGDFSRSLDIGKRHLDNSRGVFSFKLGERLMQWGAWDDLVSSQLGMAFDKMLETVEVDRFNAVQEVSSRDLLDSGCAIYRSLIQYVSQGLSFIDPVDRIGFVTRANGLVSKLMGELSPPASLIERDAEQLVRIASHNIVFANQVYQIARHNLVGQSIQNEAIHLVESASRQTVTLISTTTGQAAVRRFLSASKQRELREAGIKNGHPIVEAYVIVQHVLRSTDKGYLEALFTEAYSTKHAEGTNLKDIGDLESAWQRLYTSLPLQEFDVFGISRAGSRFQESHDNWELVKRLLDPVFKSYDAISESQPVSYYSYCRVLFHRCFILINHWGWRDCKPILDTLFDFFAKRTLYNLRLEENFKSPPFLDELDHDFSLEVLPGDPCFHILLKIIASGLRFLSKRYDNKKVRNYTWRLLPNHGRVYPKEQPIHQVDLDALRNHHDLICTLYSSVPGGCRPRLGTIRNLVHPASSHRETCKISLRSWTRLARFQLSTNEDISELQYLAEWHGYFVSEFLKQHNEARREIEAQNDGSKQFSQRLIDSTVAQNQGQIESLLKTALQGMQSAIKLAPALEHAQKIVSQTPIKSVLDLFDSRTTRLNATVMEGMQVILTYTDKCVLRSTGSQPARMENFLISADDDSQEYGDWADIEAAYGYESPPLSPGVEYVEQAFHPAVSRLVSNCFGEDRCPDDAILLTVVDCWTSVAHTLVRHRLRRWDNYLSPYQGESWTALRWTTQTRKYTPQFLASCIEKDQEALSECRVQILGMWLSSLVERESMLKFQHRLTEAIVNRNARDPMLWNLPFSLDPKEKRYLITPVELSQRRLSLVSSLLSNMRAHIQDLENARSQELTTTKHEYREVVQEMMSSMKSNYQELGNGSAEVRGSYVTFVHSVVGFLQQHSRDICPIDSFFTDPTTFPPPENDPTYIVARLRSYEPKLSSANVAKSLITFIQAVSERAALDGTQTFLVNQLHDSMKQTYEGGSPDQPTLRATLLRGVFPAYLATALNSPASWILSRPIIETIVRVFEELLFAIDTTDPYCFSSVMNIFHAIFEASYKALHRIVINANLLSQAPALKIITAIFKTIGTTLPIIDYIDRLAQDTEPNSTQHLVAQIRVFQQIVIFAISTLQNRPDRSDTVLNLPLPIDKTPNSPIDDISTSATRELQAYIQESWSFHRGKYYFTRRGQPPQEVQIEAQIAAELERSPETGLIDAASEFLAALDSLDLFGEGKSEDTTSHLPLQTLSEFVPGEDNDILLL